MHDPAKKNNARVRKLPRDKRQVRYKSGGTGCDRGAAIPAFRRWLSDDPNSLTVPIVLVGMLLIAGCQGQKEPVSVKKRELEQKSISADATPARKDKRQATAVKAKDALFAALSGRLMQVMKSEGPVAAISVCSKEAVKIAGDVSKEHGVEIGRTSFKLRNPQNAPRDWVKPLVEQRIDTPVSIPLENGNLGALFPIPLDVKCLMCHGEPSDILDDVKPELAKRYPDDQATGFKQGDLRGWFWVEVPPTQ